MKVKSLLFSSVMVAGIVVAGSGCGKKGGGKTADVAIMPGADLVMTMDMQAMRETPFNKMIEGMRTEFEEMAKKMNPDAGRMQELQDKLTELTGLKEEDFVAMTVAVELDAIDFNADEAPQNIDAVAAVQLNKALSSEKLGEVLAELAKEEPDVTIINEDYNGATLYLVPMDDADAPFKALALTMIADDKLCLIGPKQAVQNAVDRAATGETAQVSDALADMMGVAADGSQMVLGLAMTEQMKELAAKQSANAPQGPQGAAARAAKTLQGVCLSTLVDADAKINMTGVFGTAEDAVAMKSFVDNMVISGVKMVAGMMTQGQPLPLLDSLQAVADGNNASLVMVFSEQDLTTFKKIAEMQAQQQQQAPTMNVQPSQPAVQPAE